MFKKDELSFAQGKGSFHSSQSEDMVGCAECTSVLIFILSSLHLE